MRGRKCFFWFAEHGRDLPWRRTRDPYAILVSEVMLQQTQVERVVARVHSPGSSAGRRRGARRRVARGGDRRLERARLQPPGREPARAARQIAARRLARDVRGLAGSCPASARTRPRRSGPRARRDRPAGRRERPARPRRRAQRETIAASRGRAAGSPRRCSTSARRCAWPAVPRCGACPLAGWAARRAGGRYEPARKQGRFEGSFRQRRAQTLRLVAESERPLSDLDRDVVESLAQDGLVEVAPCGTLVTLP